MVAHYSVLKVLPRYVHTLTSGIPPITAFEKAGLKIQFNFERSPSNPAVTAITLTATNFTPTPITNFLFQATLPKVSRGPTEWMVI